MFHNHCAHVIQYRDYHLCNAHVQAREDYLFAVAYAQRTDPESI